MGLTKWLKSTTARPRMSLVGPGLIIMDSGRTFFATDTEDVIDVRDSASDARVEAREGAIDVRVLEVEGAWAVVACASSVGVVRGGTSDRGSFVPASGPFVNKGRSRVMENDDSVCAGDNITFSDERA